MMGSWRKNSAAFVDIYNRINQRGSSRESRRNATYNVIILLLAQNQRELWVIMR